MKKKNFKNLLLLSLITVFLLIFNFVVKDKLFIYAESIMASFMIVVLFIAYVMFGFQKDKNTRFKSSLFFQVGQVLVCYFIVIYLLGLYFGYSKIVFSLKPQSIINNIFAPIIIFIALELFRYSIINNNKDNIKNIVLYSIFIGLLELSVSTRVLEFYNLEVAYKSIADFIIPVIVKQVAFGYVGYHGGLKPLLLYRIVLVLYTYVVPVHPNFGPSLNCMCNILLPVLIFFKCYSFNEDEKREKVYITKENPVVKYVIPYGLLFVLFLTVIGVLPVGITAIASDSMHPVFNKGDAVITLKVKEDKLKKGDIISFKKDNKEIIHRISSIEKVDGEVRYFTKGDANTTVDNGYILYKDIKNRIVVSIPFIGYPSIILGEIFSR